MKGKKFAALALALGMSISFAACGGSEKSTSTGAAGGTAATETAPEAPKGTNGSWGNYTQILIPDGMKLVEGSQIDKADPDSLSLQKEGDTSTYFMFSVMDEAKAKSGVESTKSMNKDSNPTDVKVDCGGVTFQGVTYKYNGTLDCVQVYGTVNGKCINVMSAGYAPDSDTFKEVLGSIQMK